MTARGFVASRPGRPVRRLRGAATRGAPRERRSHVYRIVDAVHAILLAMWQVFVVTPTAYMCAVLYALFLSRTSHRIVLRLILLLFIQGACIILAILAFFSFYHAWVPKVALSKDLWLDYTVSMPHTSVSLHPNQGDLPVWRQASDIDLFMIDQPYDVSLELRVPPTGHVWTSNVMMDMSLFSQNNTLLYESSRSTLVVKEPYVIRWLSRLYRSLTQPVRGEPLAPLQVVRVPMLRHIVPYASATGRFDDPAFVRRRGYKATRALIQFRCPTQPCGPSLPVEHATLRFDAYLTGLPYLMFHYPLFSFGVFLLLFSGIEFVVAGSLWLLASVYFSWQAP
ncbi:hypothetical protein MEQU1_002649 [Malassezia equina]|uniref:Seipin n=1 Tax=Malassezia equina TaxID=1381935 RepID=A0AAF0EFB3_9BASI|nr:hypothetical protein MEQU1_002649 [Malassezia equina]